MSKTVLITGHTGFKGSWLAVWLKSLGAKVVGIALEPPSKPSHFEVAKLKKKINHKRIDVRNLKLLKTVFINQDYYNYHFRRTI